jgi:hypothetical protein
MAGLEKEFSYKEGQSTVVLSSGQGPGKFLKTESQWLKLTIWEEVETGRIAI